MLKKIRKIIPNFLVNYGKHLPNAVLANFKYGFPSKKMIVVGVTGTDGKTTTVNMIYQVLKKTGKNVAMISTIGAVIADKNYETGFHVTSPSPFQLQKYIKNAKEKNVEYLVLEVTSHALDQFRVWGVKFDVAIITNITQEHLDYHKNWENYFKTKAKIIKDARVAILNHDENHFTKLSKLTTGQIISFGLSKSADFNPFKFPLRLKIIGEFNLLNALSATACCMALGIDSKLIRKTLEDLTNFAGRMEEIENSLGIKIIIDFAHTVNGLENALITLKKLTKGKLIAVFGAASERDTYKRPLMGGVAAKIADIVILTDEDPRYEDRNKIINEIAQGAYAQGVQDEINLFKELDRQKAIELAVSIAKNGDTVSIFGKGHEKSMNYQGIEKPWSDKEAILKALKKKNRA